MDISSLFRIKSYHHKKLIPTEAKYLFAVKSPDNLDTKYDVNYEMRSNIAPLLSLTDLSSCRVANLFPCEAGAWPAVSPQLSTSLHSLSVSDGEEERNFYRGSSCLALWLSSDQRDRGAAVSLLLREDAEFKNNGNKNDQFHVSRERESVAGYD